MSSNKICQHEFYNMLIAEIAEYQRRITSNKVINNKLATTLDSCIKLILAAPIIAFIVFALVAMNAYF